MSHMTILLRLLQDWSSRIAALFANQRTKPLFSEASVPAIQTKRVLYSVLLLKMKKS